MSEHENNSVNNEPEATKTSNRRRFIKQGVMVAPIITAVTSRPVWADGISAISGNLSGNLSQATAQSVLTSYNGRSPEYWSDNLKSNKSQSDLYWMGDEITKNTKFNSVFINSGNATQFKTYLNTPSYNNVRKWAVTAFLNSLTDTSFPYKPQDIIDFQQSYNNKEVSKSDALIVLQALSS